MKLCGALETAHRTGTLHRDIKPANVLVNDYGEPQLSDFGTARIAGGYKTVTGFFTGTLSYTAPEVLAGNSPTVAADVYSLGASLYALIAGSPPHERKADEDLIAHYLRITSTPVPDLRPQGIPADVCAAIEKALSREPVDRYGSAAEFGRELQFVQRHNGLTPDQMALSEPAGHPESTSGTQALPLPEPSSRTGLHEEGSIAPGGSTGSLPPPTPDMFAHTASVSQSSLKWQPVPSAESPDPRTTTLKPETKKDRKKVLIAVGAAAAVLLLVVAGVFIVSSRDTGGGQTTTASQPTPEAPAAWEPIADARVARDGVAATQADGTIWVFGGMAADGRVSGKHEGYDPAIDSWKSGEELPVPVQHAMSVTWQDTPVVLGGWRTEGTNTKVATDGVWRVVNSRWVPLPPLLAATGGSGGRRGGRPHHRHRRRRLRRQAVEHHGDLRRHGVEARRPHPHSAAEPRVRRRTASWCTPSAAATGHPTSRRWRRMTRRRTRGRACPNFPDDAATSAWHTPMAGWWYWVACRRARSSRARSYST